MEQIYAIRPAPVEVFDLGKQTDIILRRDIQEITKNMEQAADGEETETYTVYSCNEVQIRKEGHLSAEEVTEDAQRLWEEAISGKTIGPTIEQRISALETAQLAMIDMTMAAMAVEMEE